MEKIKNFLKTYKYATIWTICYIAVMFIVLLLLFGFNLFSAHDWSILLRARLHGFAGFAFGILLLAAVPMYIATTTIIVRTKKPLFTLVGKKEDKKENKAEDKKEEQVLTSPLPCGIPTELRGAFLRARQNLANRPESAFDMKDVYDDAKSSKQITPVAEVEQIDAGLPIPDNFDFSTPEETVPSAPVFRDISFGGSDEKKEEIKAENKTPLIKHLEKKHYDYFTDGDAIVANGLAIATHDDSDFWIADNDNWFAAGKQKLSPITAAQSVAAKHNATPAIYLGSKNIMDLDSKITEWETVGITVLTDLTCV
ncbi:MAG: hypothetical protein LBF37_03175 [Rickettsiales bacterium]|jgi:hypothetical protein|nr:hypothetical protein [Rickettsiales bacterium]